MIELTVKEKQKLKEIQIQMFCYFIDICKKEDLQYFVVGGTALGAVRHKGFIPWDDDIDVAMPREDYEKFIKKAPELLPKHIFLQCIDTEKNCPFAFVKLRDSNTTFIETTVHKFNINHGVFLDVFQLVGYPSNRFLQRRFDFINKLYTIRNLMNLYLPKGSLKTRIIQLLLKIIFPIDNVIPIKRNKLFKKYKYKDSDIIANYNGAWGKREVMSKSYFGNGSKGLFEGIEVILPENYDKYLTSLYGDYMQLPPEEKRVSHHYCTVIDLDTSYTKYI